MVNIKNLVGRRDPNKNSKQDKGSDPTSENPNNQSSVKDVQANDIIVTKKEAKPKKVQFGQKLKEFKKKLHVNGKKMNVAKADANIVLHNSKNANKQLTRKMSYQPPTVNTAPLNLSISHYSYCESTTQPKEAFSEPINQSYVSELSQNGSMNEYNEFLNVGSNERMELHMHVNRLINNQESEESTEEIDSYYSDEEIDFTPHVSEVKKRHGPYRKKHSPEQSTLNIVYDEEEDNTMNIQNNNTIGTQIGNIYNETYDYTKNFVSFVRDKKIDLNEAYEKVAQYRMSILNSAESLINDYDSTNEDTEDSQDSSGCESTLDRMCGYVILFITGDFSDILSF